MFLSQGKPGIATGASPDATFNGIVGDNFGCAVALGDFNGDGYDDLAVGDNQSFTVYAFLSNGTSTAFVNPTSYASANTTINGVLNFGLQLATGDVNGDGFVDLAVGANNNNTVYVFQASDLGLSNTPASTMTGGGSHLLASLAVADVNGDGFMDVVAADENINTAYVWLANSDGSGISNGAAASNVFVGPASSSFGSGLAVGDVNGDGYGDLAVGATGNSAAYLFLSAGSSGVASVDLTATPSAYNTLFGGLGSDSFGTIMYFGDTNGDGYADLVFGADSCCVASAPGVAYVFQSSGTAGISSANLLSTPSAANTTITGATGNTLGFSAAP